jgi:hypothetical protein
MFSRRIISLFSTEEKFKEVQEFLDFYSKHQMLSEKLFLEEYVANMYETYLID